MNQSIVWVCIAVHNRIRYTKRSLELLGQQTYPKINIVVVDDGSTDGTSAMIKQDHPAVTLLVGDGSLYWTGATERGIAHILTQAADTDYVLIINDDLVFNKDTVEKFVQTAKQHPRALIQALESSVKDPGVIWHGGSKINWWTAKHRSVNENRRISDFPAGYVQPSAYLTGRGLLTPVRVFHEIGNFDASYQQYGDPEFTRRAAKKGYQLLVVYDIHVLSYDKGNNISARDTYSLRDLKEYYFSILSATRIKTRWKDALTMTNSFLQGLVFFAFDFIRITGHFAKRLRLRPATAA